MNFQSVVKQNTKHIHSMSTVCMLNANTNCAKMASFDKKSKAAKKTNISWNDIKEHNIEPFSCNFKFIPVCHPLPLLLSLFPFKPLDQFPLFFLLSNSQELSSCILWTSTYWFSTNSFLPIREAAKICRATLLGTCGWSRSRGPTNPGHVTWFQGSCFSESRSTWKVS